MDSPAVYDGTCSLSVGRIRRPGALMWIDLRPWIRERRGRPHQGPMSSHDTSHYREHLAASPSKAGFVPTPTSAIVLVAA